MNNKSFTKEPLIAFYSCSKGISKGRDGNPAGDLITLRMEPEQLVAMAEELTKLAVSQQKGALAIHIRKKTNTHNGQTFDSAFAFVKPVQAVPGTGARPQTFTPKPKVTETDMAAKIAAIKAATSKA